MFANQLLRSRIRRYLTQRREVWRQLHFIQSHPISKHIQHQLHKQQLQFPILPITLIWGIAVFMTMITLFRMFNELLLVVVPFFLLVFSSGYIVPWLYRIATVIKQQYRNSVMDTIGVVPPGQTFIVYAVCHAVLNERDQLGWIQISRHLITAVATLGILIATSITAALVETVAFGDVVMLMMDIAMLSLLLYAEHQQSILIGCFVAVVLPRYTVHPGNLISNTLINFVGIQILTALVPMLVAFGLVITNSKLPLFTLSTMSFLLVREVIIYGLWRKAQPLE